mmetsp:Transcript_24714/g.57914  ORF Transcript_24714/g.57914 Transcript_24714/m.57914 type:complete len:203 (-) Transcript_24714:704-1312(-)
MPDCLNATRRHKTPVGQVVVIGREQRSGYQSIETACLADGIIVTVRKRERSLCANIDIRAMLSGRSTTSSSMHGAKYGCLTFTGSSCGRSKFSRTVVPGQDAAKVTGRCKIVPGQSQGVVIATPFRFCSILTTIALRCLPLVGQYFGADVPHAVFGEVVAQSRQGLSIVHREHHLCSLLLLVLLLFHIKLANFAAATRSRRR